MACSEPGSEDRWAVDESLDVGNGSRRLTWPDLI
jgi:hypothetical protein